MLISIIIPVYNVEKFLNKCLDSIVNQTYRKLEFILVNDGSTDKSGSICDEYLQKDKRFTVLHKENGGVSSARNAGLKIANGKYIAFVDPDDWVDPYMFEKMFHLIMDYQADIVACGYSKEDVNGKVLNDISKSGILTYTNKEAINTILDTNGFFTYMCNKLFSADLIKKEPAVFFDTDIHYGEDFLFCCENILRAGTMIYDPTPFYHYIIHDNNSTSIKYSPKKLTILHALEKIINLLSSEEGINIDPFKNYYIHNTISLLMYSMQENQCKGVTRKQLKQNLFKYKLTNFTNSFIKYSFLIAKIDIDLCYFIWKLYRVSYKVFYKIYYKVFYRIFVQRFRNNKDSGTTKIQQQISPYNFKQK